MTTSYCIFLAADVVLLPERMLENGCEPSQENFGTFSLEMAHFGAIPLYILTEMLGYLLLGPPQLL